jgi:hypothetical protein
LNPDRLPPCLIGPLARIGAASVMVTGTAAMRRGLLLAEAGRLDSAETAALATELDALAELLTLAR